MTRGMRPDPWKKEKTRKYWAKQKAKGVAPPKPTKAAEERSVGQLKFVTPVPPQPASYEEEISDGSDEYDVTRLEDFDLGLDEFKATFVEVQDDALFVPDAVVDGIKVDLTFSADDVTDMSPWLVERLKGNPIRIAKSTNIPTTCTKPVAIPTAKPAAPSSELEAMLDDLLSL